MSKTALVGTKIYNVSVSNIKRKVSTKERKQYLKDYPELESWIEDLEPRDQKNYVRHLLIYCEAIGSDPRDLLTLKTKNQDFRAENLLKGFLKEEINTYGKIVKGVKFGTPLGFNIRTVVMSWYSYNGSRLAGKRLKYHYKRVHEKIQFTKENLVKFAEGQHLEFQTVIAFLSSVVPRIETLIKMDWYHVREAFDETIELPHVVIESELLKKSLRLLNVEQHGFIHSWARKKLIEWRKEYEKLTKKKLDFNNPDSLKGVPLWISTIKPYGRIGTQGIQQWFRERSEEIGKRITVHSFRAYLKTNLLTSDEDMKACFLGQSGKHNGAYNMQLVTVMRTVFREALPRINPLFEDQFKRTKQDIEMIVGTSLTTDQIQRISEKLAQHLITMETEFKQQKREFIEEAIRELREEFQQ